ncbi:MAG: BACON domain-containing protein [Bacteroidales bacterium]|nr:BACON domain-containing protein [Bacteroidales bacterium]
MIRRFICISATVLLAASCMKNDSLLEPEEIGVENKEIYAECTGGEKVIEVKSDGDFTLSFPENIDWLSFEGSSRRSVSGKGDMSIKVVCRPNKGIERHCILSLVRGRRTVEITFTQGGLVSGGIEFVQRNMTVDHKAGAYSARLMTVIKDTDLRYEVTSESGDAWITNLSKNNNYLTFNVLENTSETLSRSALIKVSRIDEPSVHDVLSITQLGSEITYSPIDFADITALETDRPLSGGMVLEGIVISDNSEGNGGPNRNLSASLQDNTLAFRTVYIQTKDGSAGVKLIFDSAEDNTLRRYDSVSILLDSLVLTRYRDPQHHVFSGATAANVLDSKSGSEFDVILKEKHISELNDSDIYTFVTLKDCEIPIRKGPFFPIDIRHTYVINKYPMPIRDIEGSSMHLITNFTASWQRDGKGIPQGSGEISGVIVHETCDNFSWDNEEYARRRASGTLSDYITEIGRIGKYQIRPITREDIALADEFDNGFSELLIEMRYYNKSRSALVKNVDGNTMYSTYPPVENPLDPSCEEIKGFFEPIASTGAIAGLTYFRDWTHLGPMEDGVITDNKGGNGVYDYYNNSAHWSIYSAITTTGLLLEENGSSWACSQWSVAKYWKAQFTTEGLDEDNFPLSVQFGAVSGLGEAVGGPRYWILEYSVDEGASWEYVDEYTVPDFPILSNRKPWQCPGPKYMTFTLPRDSGLIDNPKVMVRMHPKNTAAGTPESYDGGEIDREMKSQLNYFAIRYNKSYE